MLRDITLGQYYPKESLIHRLDPRVKIVGTFVYLVLIFCVRDFLGYGFVTGALTVIIILSRVPPKYMVRGMRPILFILFFTFAVNLITYKGTILLRLGPLKITDTGVQQAVFIAARLILLIFGTSLLTYTTRPVALTDALEKLMSPLTKIRVPAHEIAMMMSIALRFIPTLLNEADKTIKAQQARGADFESGSLIRRARNLLPLFIPLFVNAFRMAVELAMAMEARCYQGGKGRTRLHPMEFAGRDYLAWLLMALFAVLIITHSRGLLPLPQIWPLP
ncbi:MAG: energy-coupling factor transporter transmembrane protein EcfT [Lachnospiraceae bacterium]|nr:energy-coupling factor transporter transmembrane protein EcfT [Lachnospiraceae bacterium]